MMTALATVTQVTAQQQHFSVELSCEQQTSCNSCASQKSCGTGIVSKAVGKKALAWHLQTQQRLQVGEVVEIGISEQNVLRSALIVYVVPLMALIVGAMIGQLLLVPLLGLGEGIVIAASAIGAGLGLLTAKKLARATEQQSAQQVILLRTFGAPIA
ncbi:transcriptional regulator [Vibrio navarrensis]|uniref:SoxR reducing system RseC family protein n=1 Tax=Vibrio navarrensis TaxID=29495 RepID=UPI001866F43D|nr:SoxR reducing system RseC family protein [Vibrio navarrensis]EJK2115047.1 SoxR reducing system RseC family protein [Vibrio navarrensis]MBE3665070.1 transcriptional regulator [Vibrio navarrensis]MBE4574432.1 transcriptional regulator [Vibrio navarrensis]MBE4585903.1 transcriptional regulator [Vibrio navarrensis]MBE4589754.1 transcriptional regulator [Vibrio navarrensis]